MAEPTAHAEVPGGAELHAEPTALWLDASMWVALAMLVVIALMIWKKVPSAIGKSLDKKIAAIRDQLAEAEALRKDAEALKAEYEAKAAVADQEAAAMVERRKAMAEAKIAAEERAAIDELRATAAKAATAAAAKLISERNDAGTDKALVDQAIASLTK